MVIRRNKRRGSAADRAAEARITQLQAFLEDARNFTGVGADEVAGMRLRPIADERIYLCIRGVFLFETNLDLTRPEVRQARAPTPIDRGELAVTDGRAVFTGAKQIRQWAWTNLIGIAHADAGPWTAIDVSNRRRQFGVLYDSETRDQIRFSLDLVAANAAGTRDELIGRLGAEIAEAVSASPTLGALSDPANT